MPFTVALQKFQGPLDLLLELIEAEKLPIAEVALSQVTDGFLAYIDAHPDIAPEDLADFLVVAAKLLYLKSKSLLPVTSVEEEGEVSLEDQLRIYKQYLDAAAQVGRMALDRRTLYVHEKLPAIDIGFSPPEGLDADGMHGLFLGVIKRLEQFVRVPRAVVERAVSIHERITRIRALLDTAKKVGFRAVLADAETKTDIIVTFLALLELIKQRHVRVDQEGRFSDITITRTV
jgi:segregation and condensation protein A